MSNSTIAESIESIQPKTFDTLPAVLIQDSRRECAYLVSAEALREHQAAPDVWTNLDAGTVTFVIPGGDVVEELPPFAQAGEEPLSVLIQHPQADTAYFLSESALGEFRIDQPSEYPEAFEGISFVVPDGTNLIDEIPTLRRAKLQHGT